MNDAILLTAILIIVLIIILVIIYFYAFPLFIFTFWSDIPYMSGDFGNYLPKNILNDEVRVRGAPHYINKTQGGEAQWIRSGIYSRIIISDKVVPVNEPFKHLKIISYTLPYIGKIKREDTKLDHLYSFHDSELTVHSYCSAGCQALLKILIENLPSSELQPLILEFQSNPGKGFDFEAKISHHAQVVV